MDVTAAERRESGVPLPGGSQATALTWATSSGGKRRGRPARSESCNPSSRRSQNLRRHFATVSTVQRFYTTSRILLLQPFQDLLGVR